IIDAGAAAGVGEPLNVIISNESDQDVLTPQGFEEYAESIYFSNGDCAGITLGGTQGANLGDGAGTVQQSGLMRYNFMQGDGGTCIESLQGGNHFRYWYQNGSAANSGAVFLAVSYEMSASKGHMIVDNGYDFGRDLFVANATLSNGTRSPGGFEYQTTAVDNNSLLAGVQTSQINHGIPTDGIVKVLTVKITKRGTIGAGRDTSNSTDSSSSSSSTSAISFRPNKATIAAFLITLACFFLLGEFLEA
ncbi:hypothetical protein IE53DRAFT_370086, partial [Violaceomyces palustris]